MKRLFVQARLFEVRLKDFEGGGELLRSIEDEILKYPECGDVVQDTGGVRKLRLADKRRGKGKRGGLRILYLDLPDRAHTHLLFLYRKNEADDITAEEKKMIREIARKIKES